MEKFKYVSEGKVREAFSNLIEAILELPLLRKLDTLLAKTNTKLERRRKRK